jgi:hypothetical protein
MPIMEAFRAPVALSLVAGFLLAPTLVYGEQQDQVTISPDPNAQFQNRRDEWHNQTINQHAPVLAPLINPQGSLTDVQGQMDAIRKSLDSVQSPNTRPSNVVVWSDNHGIWKSEPPAIACMLQATSTDNSQPCNH